MLKCLDQYIYDMAIALITGILSGILVTGYFRKIDKYANFCRYLYDLYVYYRHIGVMLPQSANDYGSISDDLRNSLRLHLEAPVVFYDEAFLCEHLSEDDMRVLKDVHEKAEDLLELIKENKSISFKNVSDLKKANLELLKLYNKAITKRKTLNKRFAP